MSGTRNKQRRSSKNRPRTAPQPTAGSAARDTREAASTGRADSRRAQRVIAERKARRRKQLTIIGGGAGAALVLVLALVLINNSRGNGASAASEPVVPAPTVAAEVQKNGNVLGDPNAPVTVVEYGDYQCPGCGFFAQNNEQQLISEYVANGKVKFEFRNYAFLGDESVDAAAAVACADRQGKFWDFHEMLYHNQVGENKGGFDMSRLEQMAGMIGLDTAAWKSCMDDSAVRDSITASRQQALSLGINSTPTFVINDNERVSGANYDALRQKIEAALATP